MKILVLTFYYPPDLCAGSFRSSSVVDHLRALAPQGSQIDVITTLPNRYQSFNAHALEYESHDGHDVYRVPLPRHQSGMLDQSRAFLSYARGAMQHVRGKRYDLVFGTSSRLMTLMLAARVAQRTRARLYLDIRDIFVENIKEILPRNVSVLMRPLFAQMEKHAVTRAHKVNLVSPGFEGYFRRRYPQQQFAFFTNGIDDEFLAAPVPGPDSTHTNGRMLTVLYAGNLGEGQGLHTVLPGLANSMADRARFRVIGDGARKNALRLALDAAGVRNVELLDPMDRAALIREYLAADVLLMHLNDYEAFKNVLPSKVFEYAALGKPLWAGVAGFAAEFVRSEVSNAAVFPPCDVAGAVAAFDQLTLRSEPRPEFVRKYARSQIARRMAQDILAVAGSN